MVICDIDGTVADLSHRLHFIEGSPKDWSGFFDAMPQDEPIQKVINLVRSLEASHEIVFVTGRPDSHVRQTMNWLEQYGMLWGDGGLYMRKAGDHRIDSIVKAELYQKILEDFDADEILCVIEDRDQVVEMWRSKGLLCLQPKKGDY